MWESALTVNGVRVSSIHELYGERMRIYMRPYTSSDSSKSGTVRKTSYFSRLFGLATEIATLPHTALGNRFKQASFLRSERVLLPKSSMSLDTEVVLR